MAITRSDIMPKTHKNGPFTALTLRMTVISSVIVDAILAKNVVRIVTRLDIMMEVCTKYKGSLYKVQFYHIIHCRIILASYNIVN